MRRLLISSLLVVSACTGAQEIATTTSQGPLTSSTGPATTSTAPPTTTTTSLATTTTVSLDQTTLAYAPVAELAFPVQMTARPGEALSYVITKNGLVRAFDGSAVGETPVLDISDQVVNQGEQGLLSIALHPTDTTRLYLHYSDGNGDTTVSEFTLTSPTTADPASERLLLEVDQPAPNHNGGMIQFTPDGTLLLGLGDGGGADDRFGNGQNAETLLGGLVEMRVDGDPGPVKYSMGLRNPWRFWIDENLIYVADVGQDEFEEVNVASLAPGTNYGWPITEGLHCFQAAAGSCDTSGLMIPVLEVEHSDAGSCSITGGIVYRGPAIPQLDGHYFYSDYCGGYLRSFRFNGAGESLADQRDWTEQVGIPGQVTGFGVDGQGEMYVTTTGGLLKVVSAG
ncbi:MAG TPA: PQQ-dependent sugar dehydrogenase [Acidimicrobiia bacterium]|nr:PQQ-dependent sugar dehydrogenase [Acidimicrobiia bacterium]